MEYWQSWRWYSESCLMYFAGHCHLQSQEQPYFWCPYLERENLLPLYIPLPTLQYVSIFLEAFLEEIFFLSYLCSPNHPNCHCHTELLELIITCNNSAFQQWTCRTENSAVLCYLWCSFAKCWFHSEFYFCSQFATFLFWYIILCLVVCNLCVISLI